MVKNRTRRGRRRPNVAAAAVRKCPAYSNKCRTPVRRTSLFGYGKSPGPGASLAPSVGVERDAITTARGSTSSVNSLSPCLTGAAGKYTQAIAGPRACLVAIFSNACGAGVSGASRGVVRLAPRWYGLPGDRSVVVRCRADHPRLFTAWGTPRQEPRSATRSKPSRERGR